MVGDRLHIRLFRSDIVKALTWRVLHNVKSRILSFGLTLGVAAVAAILVLQVLRAGGLPNPLAHGDFGARVLDIAVLVFREGLECILVLAAVTANMGGSKRAYQRPVAAGAAGAIGATLVTWFIAVRIIESLSDNVSALNLQAATAGIAALSYLLAWLHYRDGEAPDRAVAIGAGLVTAQVITLALLTSEINAYWVLREGRFARELMVSVTWGVYATVVILIGLRRRYAPIRYFAIVLFGIALLKVFLVDLETLGGVYRIAGFMVVGLVLLVVSFLYQRNAATARLK